MASLLCVELDKEQADCLERLIVASELTWQGLTVTRAMLEGTADECGTLDRVIGILGDALEEACEKLYDPERVLRREGEDAKCLVRLGW